VVSVTDPYGRILGFLDRTCCVNPIDNTHYASMTAAPSTRTKYSHKIPWCLLLRNTMEWLPHQTSMEVNMECTIENNRSEIYALPSLLGFTEHKSFIGMTVQQDLVRRHQSSFLRFEGSLIPLSVKFHCC
jgi:hypothetical protein